jgi:hypothetical protein
MPARSDAFDQNLETVFVEGQETFCDNPPSITTSTTLAMNGNNNDNDNGDNPAPPENEPEENHDQSEDDNVDPLIESMATVRPDQHTLQVKMKSTSVLEVSPRSSPQTTDDKDQDKKEVLEIIRSFKDIKRSQCAHFRTTDLLDDDSSDKKIEDSHTSYKRYLEKEVTELKIKLAMAQGNADILQNDFNRISADNTIYVEKLEEITEKHQNEKKRADELGAVVNHLQLNANETSNGRLILETKVSKLESNYRSVMQKNKSLRHENRMLRKELNEAEKDLEGRGMESQGLKSENAWLKKQLQSNNRETGLEDLSDLGDSSDDDHVITGIRELLSARRTPSQREIQKRRSKNRLLTFNDTDSEEKSSDRSLGVEDLFDQKSKRGIFSPFGINGLSSSQLDVPSTSVLQQHEGRNEGSSHLDIDPQKSPMKWNFWSPFGFGNTENNSKPEEVETKTNESEYSSDDFISFPSEKTDSIKSISLTPPFAHTDSSKRGLVPKRLSEAL